MYGEVEVEGRKRKRFGWVGGLVGGAGGRNSDKITGKSLSNDVKLELEVQIKKRLTSFTFIYLFTTLPFWVLTSRKISNLSRMVKMFS